MRVLLVQRAATEKEEIKRKRESVVDRSLVNNDSTEIDDLLFEVDITCKESKKVKNILSTTNDLPISRPPKWLILS